MKLLNGVNHQSADIVLSAPLTWPWNASEPARRLITREAEVAQSDLRQHGFRKTRSKFSDKDLANYSSRMRRVATPPHER